jgi:hypothetical protein
MMINWQRSHKSWQREQLMANMRQMWACRAMKIDGESFSIAKTHIREKIWMSTIATNLSHRSSNQKHKIYIYMPRDRKFKVCYMYMCLLCL